MTAIRSPEDNDLYFVVEKLRLAGYAGFWVVVLVGIILTRTLGDVDLENSLLVQVFGYNNICVYFDHPPSTYVLPFLWAVTLVFLLLYMVTHWMRMRAQVEEGTLTPGLYSLLTKLKLFEAFTMVSFSTVFAVQPTAWDHTLYIHTVPFFLLQIGLVSLAFSNTLHGIKSGYWRQLELPEWFEKAAKFYCVVFALVVLFKIPAATNAMLGSPWWEQTDTFKKVARSVDVLFLFCAAVVPMTKAWYLLRIGGDKLDVVRLTTRTV